MVYAYFSQVLLADGKLLLTVDIQQTKSDVSQWN